MMHQIKAEVLNYRMVPMVLYFIQVSEKKSTINFEFEFLNNCGILYANGSASHVLKYRRSLRK